MTIREAFRARQASDYCELMSMRGPVLDVVPISGTPPYVEEYELTIKVRSIVGPEPTYRSVHKVHLLWPMGYPLCNSPKVVMISKPYTFHPNWFKNGAWSYGCGDICAKGIRNFVVSLIQSLQFNENLIDLGSVSNLDAAIWYREHKNIPSMFPCDITQFM